MFPPARWLYGFYFLSGKQKGRTDRYSSEGWNVKHYRSKRWTASAARLLIIPCKAFFLLLKEKHLQNRKAIPVYKNSIAKNRPYFRLKI
jgi:hypothetical protein